MTALPSHTFGVEFECYLPVGATRAAAAAAVAARLGKDVREVPYANAHTGLACWKVTTDGSLSDYARGCEFVSPSINPLCGEAGLAEVATICEALQDFGCTVDVKCGTHVHVGAAGSSLNFFKNLMKIYGAYEPVIDAVMPASRRGSRQAFCRSVAGVSAAAIDACMSVSDIVRTVQAASGAAAARYVKMNFASFTRHTTVEFRQHSGTLDAVKITNWIKLCVRMVERAKQQNFGVTSAVVRNPARPGTKRHLAIELLLRDSGATSAEILRATGWPSVSVPALVAGTSLQLAQRRMGRRFTYSINRAAAPAATDISIAGLCNLIGASASERQYLIQRTANLGGTTAWAA